MTICKFGRKAISARLRSEGCLTTASAPTLQAPLVYHYGHTTPAENLTLYNHCISKLAAAVELRCRANRKACVSGVIVNACGYVADNLTRSFYLQPSFTEIAGSNYT